MGAWSSKAIAPAKPPLPEARPWSDLPPELAGLVLCRLPFLADRVHFGSVCRHWRHAVRQQAPALPPAFPWIISFNGLTYRSIQDGQVHRLSRPSKSTACWGFSENWLLLARPWHGHDPKNYNFLENPLSGAVIPLPGQLDPEMSVNGFAELACIQKFIVCSNNVIVATTISCPLVACCRPGMSSWSTSLHAGGESYYEDIAFYNGGIYAITTRGDLFAHEVSVDNGNGEATVSSAKQVIKGSDTGYEGGITRFLVVSSCGNKLLMVNHEKCHGVLEGYVFKVFEADVEMARWSQLASLGDQVLFLSRKCSKTIPASTHDDEYFRGDKIYFVDRALQGPEKCRSPTGLTSCGMYDMRNNTYHPILSDNLRVGDVMSWFFPHK
jgi:hypothetical protein